MKLLTELDETIGRTVTAVEPYDQGGVALAFTDGSYIRLATYGDGDGGNEVYVNTAPATDDLQLALGFIDEEEWRRRADARRESDIRARESAERKEYERLRAKFGDAR